MAVLLAVSLLLHGPGGCYAKGLASAVDDVT